MQKFFTKAAWVKIIDFMAKLEEDPKWKCGACHKDLSLSESVVCESCLVWYHLKYIGLTVAPKRAVWLCHGTKDGVRRKETADSKSKL